MAKKEEKKDEKGKDAKDAKGGKDGDDKKEKKEKDETPEGAAKKSKLKLILGIGGVASVALGVGGFFIFKTVTGKPPATEASATNAHGEKATPDAHGNTPAADGKDAHATPAADAHGAPAAGAPAVDAKGNPVATPTGGAATHKKGMLDSDEEGFGETYELKKIEVNLGNPLENRYLKLGLTLEYRGGKDQMEDLKKRDPQIRDILLSTVTSKTRLELLAPSGKEKLRREILNKLNEVLDQPITSVFFTEFLVE